MRWPGCAKVDEDGRRLAGIPDRGPGARPTVKPQENPLMPEKTVAQKMLIKIHAYAMTVGLVGVALISVDDDWSAMRFKQA